MAGRYYYQRHISTQGEPLVNEPHVQEELERALPATEGLSSSFPSLPPSSTVFQDWWESRVLYRPGESTPIAVFAAAYARDTQIDLRDPGKDFGQLLQTFYPHIVRDKKKQLMATVEGIRAKRMVLVDYGLCKQEDEVDVKKEYPLLELDSDVDYWSERESYRTIPLISNANTSPRYDTWHNNLCDNDLIGHNGDIPDTYKDT